MTVLSFALSRSNGEYHRWTFFTADHFYHYSDRDQDTNQPFHLLRGGMKTDYSKEMLAALLEQALVSYGVERTEAPVIEDRPYEKFEYHGFEMAYIDYGDAWIVDAICYCGEAMR